MSRGVGRLRCFFYLSRACGAYFFELAVVAMCSKWSSSLESTQPPDGSSRFFFVGARRVFASSTNTCYLLGRRPCFSRLIHSGRLVPGWLMVEAVSEAFAVCCSHSLGFSGFWRNGIVLLENISGRRTYARRGFAMFLIMHIFLQQAFSSLNVSSLLPFGSNKLCIFVSALGLSSL